jgi:hypothetical protein
MDEGVARGMIKEHFDWCGKDEVRASEIYAEDAVIEFPQSGERIRTRRTSSPFVPLTQPLSVSRCTGRSAWVKSGSTSTRSGTTGRIHTAWLASWSLAMTGWYASGSTSTSRGIRRAGEVNG